MKSLHAALIVICLSFNFDWNAAARSSKKNNMPTVPIKLYYLPPSPPCRVVMMAARVIGIELELNLTNILEGQHLTPEFIKMNPQHTIPTMDDNGFILWESRAILTYFANAYGKEDSLYPRNPRSRALVDQRLYFDMGTLYQRYIALYGPMLFHGQEFNEEAGMKMNDALAALNTMLEGRVFVASDSMTIADIAIVVTITNLDAFGYDMSPHQNILSWFERMKKELAPYGYEDIDVHGANILASFLQKS